MTQTIPDSDLIDLEDLVSSPGWRVFVAHLDDEWGAVGFARKVSNTIGNPTLDPALAVAQLQQATVTQREVMRLRDWATDRIKTLKQQTIAQLNTPSRRGPGL
jgi:hypothetical protein